MTQAKTKPRTCHICGTVTDTFCPTCLKAYETRRAVADMTVDERAAELEQWMGPLEIPFTKLHKRVEELMCRPVLDIEMAWPDALVAEIRGGTPLSIDGIVDKVGSRSGKPVIPVVVS